MKLTFERKLPLVLFFVFLMLVSVGFLSYQYTVSLQEAVRRERHTQDVLVRIDKTLTDILDSNSFVEGFVQTGNSTYEDRFDARRRLATENLAELRSLNAESAVQTANTAKLENSVNAYWELAEAKIDRRKSEGPELLDQEASWMEFTNAINRIRTELDAMRLAEQTDASNYSKELDRDLFRTIWILIAAGFAGVISLAVANALVWSEGRRRAKAENALVDANRELETRIADRTEELREVNKNLEAAAKDRELLLENEKQARREAEIATRLRDEFMATVSHELKTPLNSILGWARLLKGGTLDESKSAKALNTIIKNSETQNRLIEDLLDVARLISGKLELEKKPLTLEEVVNHSIESVQPQARAKSIAINTLATNGNGGTTVYGDHNRLQQVFTNLLTNSLKFTPENGVIDVSLNRLVNSVEVSVTDSGAGISAEFLPAVFERFRQDTASESRKNGLGLGLAIVRNLVEMHGGNVRAASEGENKGATFTVSLPLNNS